MVPRHRKEASMNGLHPAHATPQVLPLDDTLHVVTMVSNPVRWRSRYENYWRFHDHVSHSGAILWTVEVAFGDRPFEVTEPDDPHHLQLRTRDELWHKENALNLLIERLPSSAKYIAWVDADVKFARADWVQETLQQLQHFDFVQMFSHAQDLTADYAPGSVMTGFVYNWLHDRSSFDKIASYGAYATYGTYGRAANWHPGYAWPARRSAL